MTYYRNTGTKISEYTKLEIKETNNKFPHAPSFICYASNMSGTNGINKNYQVPMQSIRADVRGFVGLRNAKPSWNNMLSVWYGEYQSTNSTINPNDTYIKTWDEEKEATKPGYIADKFKDTNDGKDIITSRVFLLKNIPFPFEETITDPKPSTHKIVDKKYVDQRLNGIRKVKIEEGQIIYLRPYQCLYCFNNEVGQISINYDNLKSDNDKGDKTGYTALNDEMFLEFYIEIPKPKTSSSTLLIEVNNNGSFTPVKWSFDDQLKSMIEASTDRVLIKCFANKSSTDNQLVVRCTNAMNLKPGKGEGGVSIETTETISKENENSKKIPTQGAVVNYVNDTLDTLNDKLGSTISSIDGGDFIDVAVDDDETTKVNLTLKTTGDIKNVENEVPTSKAVYGHTNNQDIHVTKADKDSWDNKIDSIIGDDFITKIGHSNIKLSLNTTEEIIDSDVCVPTSKAVYDHINDVYDYINGQEDHEQWHKSKNYSHIITNDGLNNLGQVSINSTLVGQPVYGLVFLFPIGVKINTINVSTVVSNGNALTNGEGKYAKVWNYTTKELICTSYEGKRQPGAVNNHNILFDFYRDNDKNQSEDEKRKTLYCLPNLKYIITFHDTKDSTEPIQYNVAYNTAYYGKSFVQHYFDNKNLEQEIECPTSSGSSTVKGFAVRFISSSVTNKEFTDIEHELSNLYQHTNEQNNVQNQDVTDHINNTTIHVTAEEKEKIQNIPDFTETWTNENDYEGKNAQQISAFVLGVNHFVNNKAIRKIEIPHDSNTGSNITSGDLWLAVQKSGDNTVYYSDKPQSYNSSKETGAFEFTFDDNPIIIKNCDSVYFALVTEKGGTFGENYLPTVGQSNFRCYVLGSPADESSIYDDGKDCKCQVIWPGTTAQSKNWVAIIRVTCDGVDSHFTNSSIHITQEERNRWNEAADRIAELEATIATLTTQLSQLTAQN